MDFNDFIIGEKYNISALAIEGSFAGEKYAVFKLPTGRTFLLRAEDFEAVSPANGIKNTEPAPKYDPNRKFREGDIVKPCQVKGRWHSVSLMGRSGIHFTVTEDEDENGIVSIKDPDCKLPYITAAVFFELVTPVEELEPYIVAPSSITEAWRIVDTRMDATVATIFKAHPNAKAAAEAERDRLNAKHRKETK